MSQNFKILAKFVSSNYITVDALAPFQKLALKNTYIPE
jgi:hypothetical protein